MENSNFPGNQNPALQLEEIVSLLQAGKKINAIKAYRAATGAALPEAKAAVERMEQAIQMGRPLEAEVVQMANVTDIEIGRAHV